VLTACRGIYRCRYGEDLGGHVPVPGRARAKHADLGLSYLAWTPVKVWIDCNGSRRRTWAHNMRNSNISDAHNEGFQVTQQCDNNQHSASRPDISEPGRQREMEE
jgi:hypothetical protein